KRSHRGVCNVQLPVDVYSGNSAAQCLAGSYDVNPLRSDAKSGDAASVNPRTTTVEGAKLELCVAKTQIPGLIGRTVKVLLKDGFAAKPEMPASLKQMAD